MTPLEWMEYGTLAASGLAVACVTFVVCKLFLAARDIQSDTREVLITETTSGTIRALLPMARYLGSWAGSFLGRNRQEGWYARYRYQLGKKLAAAGSPQGLNADEYVGFWIILVLVTSGMATVLYLLLLPDPVLNVYEYFAAGAFLGGLWWFAWLSQKKTLRTLLIRQDLPFALDLMTLGMEAGLDFTTSLARIVQKIGDTPLGREFSLMLHEIRLGKTRSQALRDLAERVDLQEVRSVVSSLVQAEELGASLGKVLRILSAQQREQRSQRAEEMAMKTPVKLLGPLVMFLFPATLLAIFGPLLIQFLPRL